MLIVHPWEEGPPQPTDPLLVEAQGMTSSRGPSEDREEEEGGGERTARQGVVKEGQTLGDRNNKAVKFPRENLGFDF